MTNKTNNWLYGNNVIFPLLEGDCEKKIMNWDGADIASFAETFSSEDLAEMVCWSENHAFGSCTTWHAFPDLDLLDASSYTPKIRTSIIKGFITDCLMMVAQGQVSFDTHDQKCLVNHFYKLWMATNGENDELS